VIAKVEGARKEGLEITADMYNYTAGSTGSTRDAAVGAGREATRRGRRGCRIRKSAIASARDDGAEPGLGET
jgi:N-acyl-D-amino-acid deacylase